MDADTWAMELALQEAKKALREGEVPVGAVVVRGDRVLARAHNLSRRLGDPTAHAELLAMAEARRALGATYLEGCRLYVTLEPCLMCAGAAVLHRVEEVVFGARDPKAGANTLYGIPDDPRLPWRPKFRQGPLGEEAAALLREFFEAKR